jgi:hypothetical protein
MAPADISSLRLNLSGRTVKQLDKLELSAISGRFALARTNTQSKGLVA